MRTRFLWSCGLALGIAGFAAGCGGSSSPSDPDVDNLTKVNATISLNVGLRASQTRVGAGDSVKLSATVNAVRAETLRFSWVNVTGHGRLIGAENGMVTGPFTIEWQAPGDLRPGTVQVEVIHLIVTAISQVISVDETGVRTSHDVVSQTKTVPISIVVAQ